MRVTKRTIRNDDTHLRTIQSRTNRARPKSAVQLKKRGLVRDKWRRRPASKLAQTTMERPDEQNTVNSFSDKVQTQPVSNGHSSPVLQPERPRPKTFGKGTFHPGMPQGVHAGHAMAPQMAGHMVSAPGGQPNPAAFMAGMHPNQHGQAMQQMNPQLFHQQQQAQRQAQLMAAQNPALVAQMRQQQMMNQQRQQQMLAQQQGIYSSMAGNGMPVGQHMNPNVQMTAQQFQQIRNNINAAGMRPMGVPAHIQQAHLAQQGQHPQQHIQQQAMMQHLIQQQQQQQQQQQMQHAGQPGHPGQMTPQQQMMNHNASIAQQMAAVNQQQQAQQQQQEQQQQQQQRPQQDGQMNAQQQDEILPQPQGVHGSASTTITSENPEYMRSRIQTRQRRQIGVHSMFVLRNFSRDNTAGNEHKRSQCMAILGTKHAKGLR